MVLRTENGWYQVPASSCEWTTIPGTNVTLQIQKGWPLTIMRAFAADFNAYVEPLRDPDSACWTPTNSVATSNHLSGTAMDLNWNSHPFQVLNAGFDAAKIATIRELLAFYEDTIFWGNDWTSPKDAMHFQMGYDTYNNGHTQDFINRKIRPDGYSTFRRGTAVNAASVLAQAAGIALAKAAAILPQVRDGLVASNCNTVKRIAMWLAQIGHESDGFNATEEYKKDGRYAPYIGRTWIQITWDYNYRAFSEWCYARGLVSTPTYFVDHPVELADLKWAGLGPAWYWTVARPAINALCDAGDLIAVTKAINGGLNGLEDQPNGAPGRRTRYNRALAMGDQLLALTNGGDDMFTDADRDLLKQVAEYRRKSLSPLRWPYEGAVNTCAGFAWTADANIHVVLVEKLAVEYGDPQSVALLLAVSRTDEPGREDDTELAAKILAKVTPDAVSAGERWLAEHRVD